MPNGWSINKSISIADVFKIMGLVGVGLMFVRQTEMRDQDAVVNNERTMMYVEKNAESINRLTGIVERHELLLQENLIWRAKAEAIHEAGD